MKTILVPIDFSGATSRVLDLARQLGARRFECEATPTIGNMVGEILKCEKTTKADAIVMGQHGHGAMYKLLVGSVTEGVVKRAACPVLLVPTTEQSTDFFARKAWRCADLQSVSRL